MTDEIIATDQPPKRRTPWRKIGMLFSTLGFIILIAALGFGFYYLACVNISMTKMVGQLQQQTTQHQTELTTVKQSLAALQQNAQNAQALSEQQAKLVAEWRAAQKGNLEKWYIAEAANLVRLAQDQAEYLQNIPLAITLLQRADQVLQNVQTTDVQPLHKSLTDTLTNLQSLSQLDVSGLYVRLMSLSTQIDQLPLPVNPLQTSAKATEDVPKDLPWWKAGLAHSWQALRQIVIVRNLQASQPPIVLPEEKLFLYQNLQTQLQNAVWGALHRNSTVYQLSLAQLQKWIPKYFVQDAAITKEVLQNVSELIKVDVQAPAVNFSDTIKLFDQYFAQSESQPVSTTEPTSTQPTSTQ